MIIKIFQHNNHSLLSTQQPEDLKTNDKLYVITSQLIACACANKYSLKYPEGHRGYSPLCLNHYIFQIFRLKQIFNMQRDFHSLFYTTTVVSTKNFSVAVLHLGSSEIHLCTSSRTYRWSWNNIFLTEKCQADAVKHSMPFFPLK